jgi:hypothetical protein
VFNFGRQVVPVAPELVSRLLGSNRVAVSPMVTLEPRRRKFHQPVMLTVPLPRAVQRGMINQYGSGGSETPNLRLLCSVFGLLADFSLVLSDIVNFVTRNSCICLSKFRH